jgi:AbrB family looped-hinge helix DNA binding protein
MERMDVEAPDQAVKDAAKGARSVRSVKNAAQSVEETVTNRCFHGYVAVQSRGTVALPAQVRKRLHLDEPGAQVEITEREDGVLELRPTVAVPADQAWFWTDRWQEGERAVDAHVVAGETTVHEDADALIAHLAALDAE